MSLQNDRHADTVCLKECETGTERKRRYFQRSLGPVEVPGGYGLVQRVDNGCNCQPNIRLQLKAGRRKRQRWKNPRGGIEMQEHVVETGTGREHGRIGNLEE